MAYARYVEFERSDDRGTPTYDAVQAKLGVEQDPPPGLILHSAGFNDDGAFRIYEVWESRQEAERFFDERIMPAIQEATEGDPSFPAIQETYELHNLVRPG
jgi:hypothetical protein